MEETVDHARPVADAPPPGDWSRLENEPEFRTLVTEKRRFLVPATIFFCAYYFALPVLVGYFPDFMDTRVIGPINLAYLFALSQFFMAWVVMALYVRRARGFDRLAAAVRARAEGAAR